MVGCDGGGGQSSSFQRSLRAFRVLSFDRGVIDVRYGMGIEEKSPSLDSGPSEGYYFDEFPVRVFRHCTS